MNIWKRFIREWFVFSKNERWGFIVVSVILCVVMSATIWVKYVKPVHSDSDKDKQQQMQHKVDSLASLLAQKEKYRPQKKNFDRRYAAQSKARTFYFDPNTISADSLMLLGFSVKQAEAIIKYRQRIVKFRKPEDFLKLNIVSRHQHLADYIRMEQQPSKTAYSASRDTAAAIKPKPKTVLMVVDINSADTTELKMLPGIGSYFAKSIVKFRQKLGGYVHLEQLCEIKLFDADKLSQLRPMLKLDSSNVKKFRLNTEDINRNRSHPYMGYDIARGITLVLKYKKSITLEELARDGSITPEQAARLKDYIIED